MLTAHALGCSRQPFAGILLLLRRLEQVGALLQQRLHLLGCRTMWRGNVSVVMATVGVNAGCAVVQLLLLRWWAPAPVAWLLPRALLCLLPPFVPVQRKPRPSWCTGSVVPQLQSGSWLASTNALFTAPRRHAVQVFGAFLVRPACPSPHTLSGLSPL